MGPFEQTRHFESGAVCCNRERPGGGSGSLFEEQNRLVEIRTGEQRTCVSHELGDVIEVHVRRPIGTLFE